MTASAAAPVLATRLDGPAVERDIALDIVKRALPVVPAVVAFGAIGWGVDGALSAGYGLALVVANFVLAASLLAWSARISLALMMGTALFGYLARLGVIFLAVQAIGGAGWREPLPLGLTIVASHLGLLVWELRYVSASLAFPGLKPAPYSMNKETTAP